MDVGWNFRREHLRLATRLPYVITNGGDQPNVVPPNASNWYYYREADYEHIMNLWRIGARCVAYDRYNLEFAPARQCVAGSFQQADRGSDGREYPQGRFTNVVG